MAQEATGIGPAENATEVITPVPLAWSEADSGQWLMPASAWSYRRTRRALWLGLPALGVAGAILAYALTGGQSRAVNTQPVTTAPVAAVTPTPPPLPAPHMSNDDQYIAEMERNHIGVADPASVIKSAHILCANLLNGATRDDANRHLWDAVKDHGYTYADAVEYVALSIQFYCPQY